MEPRETHRRSPRSAAPGRKATGQDRGAARCDQAHASIGPVILPSTNCRLYYRLVSNIELSAYAGQTPDEAKTSALHILNDWAEIAPARNNIGGFAYSEWANTKDKTGLGDTMF